MKTTKRLHARLTSFVLLMALGAVAGPSAAFNLSKSDDAELNFDVEAMLGTFHSEHSYGLAGLRTEKRSVSWQEGLLKAGFSGERKLGAGALYGAVNLVGSFTAGDGDAAGLTTGDENRVALEDLYVGWPSDLFDISAGSHEFTIGDGWLINGDGLNFGKGFEDADPTAPKFDRGGGYWLAARKAFRETVVLRAGGETGLRGDLFYLKSDNPAQVKMGLAGVNIEYVSAIGTFGTYYLHGLEVDRARAQYLGLTHRDGQKTYSARYQGNAGVENLFLSAEFTNQDQGNDTRRDAKAWYAEAGWTFADLPWSPTVNARVGRFEEGFDPLFYGFSRGYGTWFQGEVSASYAGPLNSNARFKHLGLKLQPSKTLTLGALLFDFDKARGLVGETIDARELNLYAEWWVRENLMISPVLGFYDPRRSAAQGGVQNGSGVNTYAQMIALFVF